MVSLETVVVVVVVVGRVEVVVVGRVEVVVMVVVAAVGKRGRGPGREEKEGKKRWCEAFRLQTLTMSQSARSIV